jgi:hypothetical protein
MFDSGLERHQFVNVADPHQPIDFSQMSVSCWLSPGVAHKRERHLSGWRDSSRLLAVSVNNRTPGSRIDGCFRQGLRMRNEKLSVNEAFRDLHSIGGPSWACE